MISKPQKNAGRNATKAVAATAVDLFCGAGGLTNGLLKSGISVAAGFDIDEACKYAYEHNNDPAQFKDRSVSEITGDDLAKLYPANHRRILVGCAPCQPFSKYRQGYDNEADEKWSLLHEFGRLVFELRPDIVSMENVPQLQGHSVFSDFLEMLDFCGYYFTKDEKKRVIYCPKYGIAQGRERLVVIASRLGPIKLIKPTHSPRKYRTVENAIGNLPPLNAGEVCDEDPLHRASGLSALNLERIQNSIPGGTWRDWPEHLVANCHREETGETYGGVYGRMEWKKPSPTITTQFYGFGNGRFGHPEQNRGLTLREGAILQSFPRGYEFIEPDGEHSFKNIGRMIGNAVPVRLGEIVGRTIRRHLETLRE